MRPDGSRPGWMDKLQPGLAPNVADLSHLHHPDSRLTFSPAVGGRLLALRHARPLTDYATVGSGHLASLPRLRAGRLKHHPWHISYAHPPL